VAKKVGKEAVEQTGISFIEHGAKAHAHRRKPSWPRCLSGEYLRRQTS
jgi:hypothetical protein